jgi:hypothetical protein
MATHVQERCTVQYTPSQLLGLIRTVSCCQLSKQKGKKKESKIVLLGH